MVNVRHRKAELSARLLALAGTADRDPVGTPRIEQLLEDQCRLLHEIAELLRERGVPVAGVYRKPGG